MARTLKWRCEYDNCVSEALLTSRNAVPHRFCDAQEVRTDARWRNVLRGKRVGGVSQRRIHMSFRGIHTSLRSEKTSFFGVHRSFLAVHTSFLSVHISLHRV